MGFSYSLESFFSISSNWFLIILLWFSKFFIFLASICFFLLMNWNSMFEYWSIRFNNYWFSLDLRLASLFRILNCIVWIFFCMSANCFSYWSYSKLRGETAGITFCLTFETLLWPCSEFSIVFVVSLGESDFSGLPSMDYCSFAISLDFGFGFLLSLFRNLVKP